MQYSQKVWVQIVLHPSRTAQKLQKLCNEAFWRKVATAARNKWLTSVLPHPGIKSPRMLARLRARHNCPKASFFTSYLPSLSLPPPPPLSLTHKHAHTHTLTKDMTWRENLSSGAAHLEQGLWRMYELRLHLGPRSLAVNIRLPSPGAGECERGKSWKKAFLPDNACADQQWRRLASSDLKKKIFRLQRSTKDNSLSLELPVKNSLCLFAGMKERLTVSRSLSSRTQSWIFTLG